MSFTIIIPSRFGSTRLPGKALLDIAGKPMVQRVYEQSCQSKADEVLVATDDPRIAEVVTGFGGQVVMTSADHPSGTDRLQEVVSKKNYDDNHVVVSRISSTATRFLGLASRQSLRLMPNPARRFSPKHSRRAGKWERRRCSCATGTRTSSTN